MKTFAPYLGWVLLGIMIVLIIMYAKGCFKPGFTDGPSQDSVFYWKDLYGKEVASLKATEAEFGQIRQHDLDSIAKVFGSKPGSVKEVVTVTKYIHDTVPGKDYPVLTYVHDTLQKIAQVFTDPWFVAQAMIDLKDHDKSFLTFTAYDSSSIVWKEVKEGGLFNRKTFLEIDVKNTNPHVHITGITATRIPAPKPKKFGIGIFAGYGYGFVGNGSVTPYPVIGIGGMYTFIRF